MAKIKTKLGAAIGTFNHGNWLDNSSSQHDRRSIFKRPNDLPASRPTKRSRHDEDGDHNTVTNGNSLEVTPGSQLSQSPSQPRSVGRDSQSVRSSGDGDSKALGMTEYRAATKYTAGSSRSRHKKSHERLLKAHTNPYHGNENLQKTSAGFPIKRRLILGHEISHDRIEDDDELAAKPKNGYRQISSQASRNGRHASARLFPIPSSSIGEFDEDDKDGRDIMADLPSATRRPTMKQDAKAHPVKQTYSLKRPPAETRELESSHVAKRRSKPLDEADIPTTTFAPSNIAKKPDEPKVLFIETALCEPNCIYPASSGMQEHAPGATNKKCYLAETHDKIQPFQVIDDNGQEVDELEWVVPKVTKINRILFSNKRPIIKIIKARDDSTKIRTGSTLTITFGTVDEARFFIRVCQRVKPLIKAENSYSENLLDHAHNLKKEIENRNMSIASKEATPANVQIPKDKPAITRPPSKPVAKSQETQSSHSSHYAQTKALRMQMRAGDGPINELAEKETTAKTLVPKSHAEEGELRKMMDTDLVSTDKLAHDHEEQRSARSLASSTKPDSDEEQHASQSQRSLRSTRFQLRSPTPPSERWTMKHPDWETELAYKIPLIYERTTIRATDIERLDEGQFLNDELISFYAKYLHNQMERRDAQMSKRVYVFNSFFWDTLTTKGHDGVKNWTAKIDLLSFDYIIVPINQSAHWFLAIICNPGGLLPREKAVSSQDETLTKGEKATTAISINDSNEDINITGEAQAQANSSNKEHVSGKNQVAGQQTLHAKYPEQSPTGKKAKASKKSHGSRKYHPKEPRVITLDSLDGSHPGVPTALKHYLREEIKHRKGIDIDLPHQFGMTAKDIPCQDNFTDCGVYLLGYLEEFMKGPVEFTTGILQHDKRDWSVNAPALRSKIRDLIFKLHRPYQQDEIRKKKEQRRAKTRNLEAKANASSKSPSKESSTGPPVSGSTGQEPLATQAVTGQPLRKSTTPVSTAGDVRRQAPSESQPQGKNTTENMVKTKQSPVKSNTRKNASPPPKRRQRNESGQPHEQERKVLDITDSMIVNPNESMEMPTQSKPPRRHNITHIIKSVEDGDGQAHPKKSSSSSSSGSSTSSLSDKVPRKPKHLSQVGEVTDQGFDERKMLKPLPSSPSEAKSRDKSLERPTFAPDTAALLKDTSPKKSLQKSRFFLQTGGSQVDLSEYATVPSSGSEDEMSRKSELKKNKKNGSAGSKDARKAGASTQAQVSERFVVDLT